MPILFWQLQLFGLFYTNNSIYKENSKVVSLNISKVGFTTDILKYFYYFQELALTIILYFQFKIFGVCFKSTIPW